MLLAPYRVLDLTGPLAYLTGKMLADLGGRSVHRARDLDTTVLGAAQLAGLATGVFTSLSDCRVRIAAPLAYEPGLDEGSRSQRRARWAEAIDRTRSTRPPPRNASMLSS